MAVLKIFAVKDTKVGAFSAPVFLRNRGEAVRTFSDAVADPKLAIHNHRADYELWELGSFDDNTGELVSGPIDRCIGANEFGPDC